MAFLTKIKKYNVSCSSKIQKGYIHGGEVVVMAVELGVRCGTLKYLNKLQNPENSSIRC